MGNNEIRIPLLTSEDIEVKIKQVTKTGALALLYKTARVDRRILNDVFGPMNWTSDYKVVKDNLYCGIGIRTKADEDFVWKWDCGIESRGDDDGNEKKGEASDAFKRAGFAVGIGEELYSSPFIWLEVETVQTNGKWVLKDPYAKYVVTHIGYNEKTRVITELDICNAKSNVKVFSWTMATTGAMAQKMVNTLSTEEGEDEDATQKATRGSKTPLESTKASSEGNYTPEDKKPLEALISAIGKMVKNMYSSDGNAGKYNAIIKKVTGDNTFKCNAATEEQYDTVLAIYNELIAGGYNGK